MIKQRMIKYLVGDLVARRMCDRLIYERRSPDGRNDSGRGRFVTESGRECRLALSPALFTELIWSNERPYSIVPCVTIKALTNPNSVLIATFGLF